MVKIRMNTADVAAEVKCLRRLIGMRCSNVYDLTPKTYMFKLMNSSGVTQSGESEKVLLLMESGIRLHTTAYVRDKSTTPSGFTLKLRKHIRTRRLEDVRQLGYDRIVVFQFGLGANAYYIILELYAQGNILLADAKFTVMTLLRSHRDDDKELVIMSRHHYPVEACRVFEHTSITKLQAALTCSKTSGGNDLSEINGSSHSARDTSKEQVNGKNGELSDRNKKADDSARSKKATLKTVLGEALGYGPALSEHIILDAGVLPNMKIVNGSDGKIDDHIIQILAKAVSRFEEWLSDIISGETIPAGYIIMQKRGAGKEEGEGNPDKVYDEFCPILLNQFKSKEYMQLENFDAALDEFYSKIESQRAEQHQKAKEGSSMQKLNKIRLDQENRVHTLKKEVDRCTTMAQLIEYNLEDVDAAILAVRVALANGMNWEDLARMVKEEKKSGNPVAGLIDKLHLERNCITLILSNNLDDMDDDEKTQPADKVEVDLALSAHANARRWYELKKRQENKQEKTVTAHEKAFKAAERKMRFQLSQEKTVAAISHMRKVHWFEKFNWFISSENYLVISGRDAQQNEMIVKRYMSKGDLYVHADLHGASSTVIKNHKPEYPVPPLTLSQAGSFTVCHSQAWDSKIVTSAWWVYPYQVSKTAPTGEYLTVGSFMIRGKKNFLPPHPLVMGFGILFRLDESSLGPHLNERRVRGEEDGLNDMEERVPVREHAGSETDEDITSEIANEINAQNHLPNSRTDTSQTNGDLTSESDFSHSGSLPKHEAANSCEDLVGDKTSAPSVISNEHSSAMAEKDLASISPELEVLLDSTLGIGSAKLPGIGYGYDASEIALMEDRDHEETKAKIRLKPYISKVERRKLKKGQKDGSSIETGGDGKQEHTGNNLSGVQTDINVDKLKPSGGKITRGQKGKLKKIKEKYAKQDEEERKIRMTLLASAGKALKNEKQSKDQNGEGAAAKEIGPATGHCDSAKVCYKCKRPGHLSRDCQENLDEADPSEPGLLKQVPGGVREDVPEADLGNVANEMDKMTFTEDDIHEIGEDEKEKLTDIDYLTGNPLPNDILLYAVPVCGPYNALQTYKYRVKMTPGTAKKGKAAKTAMNLFSHMSEATEREKELMKACTDPELVAAIVGNVKITAAGLTHLKQKQKKGKKTKKDDN